VKLLLRTTAPVVLLLFCLPALAEQEIGGVGFSGSGFLTLAAGKILKGDAQQDFNGFRAPIYAADFAQGGIYESGGWSMKPVSKLGLQGTATFNPQLSLTGQAVARGTRDGKVNVEWLYGNYAINDQLTLQAGRKRLPLFFFSESQDVGFAYPWVHLPPGQYGWEVVNYNGANLLYRSQWGAWSAGVNVFSGNETRNDNPYWKTTYGKDSRTNSKWTNIVGTDLSLTRDWLETRVAFIQSDFQNTDEGEYLPKARQRIYSLSFRIDYQDWLLHNEYLYMDRKHAGEEDYSYLVGVGYRIGKYLPMLTYNRYWQRLTPDPRPEERWSVLALSLRYELTTTSALKIQLDRWRDRNGPDFNLNSDGNSVPYGNPRLLSLSYDMVF
jgi:hypothetical protein